MIFYCLLGRMATKETEDEQKRLQDKENREQLTLYLPENARRRLLISRHDILRTGSFSEQLLAYVGAPDLAKASLRGFTDIVLTLLEIPEIDVDEVDTAGRTPLLLALNHFYAFGRDHGREDCCRLLIQHGADVNYRMENDLITPLHHAAVQGYHRLIVILLQAHARINEKCEFGSTPLTIAIRRGTKGSIRCADILLRSGADTSEWDYEWIRTQCRPPIHRASSMSVEARAFMKKFLDSSLKHQTREAIRKQLSIVEINGIAPRIKQLDLPLPLKRYLLYRPGFPETRGEESIESYPELD